MNRRRLFTIENGRSALFIILTSVSNLSACFALPVGVKYIVGVVIIGWCLLEFAVRPDFNKAKHFIKYFLLFFFPFFLFWAWSLVIWISQLQTADYIIRGSLNTIYMAVAVGMVVGSYYLLGKRSVYLNFYTMCLANLLVLVTAIVRFGPARLFSEYITLLGSFATETGGAIGSLELHDMVFGFGPYIIFFLVSRKNGKIQLGHLALAIFFFTLALKRVAAIAVVLSAVFIAVYLYFGDKGRRRIGAIAGYAAIAVAVLYLWTIKSGVIFDLADRFNIDMMYRDVLYRQYSDFYELSPSFLGLGVRFIYRYEQANQELVHQLHNSFLQMYIEVGFWVWFIWLWYELRFRVYAIGKRYGFRAAAFMLAGTIYMFCTYATDNTIYYWPPNVSLFYLSLFWSEENRNVSSAARLPQPGPKSKKRRLLPRFTF